LGAGFVTSCPTNFRESVPQMLSLSPMRGGKGET
jgi:hypothetical protein